jgi:hypothetical protein
MNIRKSLTVAAGLVLAAAPVAAQQPAGAQPACQYPTGAGITNSDRITSDACQKIHDFAAFMAPVLGTSLIGGNTTLGQGGTLGGLGHFSIGVRANVLRSGTLPRIDQVGVTSSGATQSNIAVDDVPVGLPAVDAAIGVFRGFPLGLTNVGGIDLLFSATYIPEIEKDRISITVPGGSLKIGYGARVGLLQESLLLPGVGVSILKRDLPATTIVARTGDDVLELRELETKTTAWRLTASKSLLLFGLAAGVGQDKFSTSTTGFVSVNETVAGTPLAASETIPFKQDLTRTNYFVDLSVNLLLLKLVAEIGQVSGGDITTFNRFTGTEADASRVYFSVGARVGF